MFETSLLNLGMVEAFHHYNWNVYPVSATATLSTKI